MITVVGRHGTGPGVRHSYDSSIDQQSVQFSVDPLIVSTLEQMKRIG